jgi:hypothetical protein
VSHRCPEQWVRIRIRLAFSKLKTLLLFSNHFENKSAYFTKVYPAGTVNLDLSAAPWTKLWIATSPVSGGALGSALVPPLRFAFGLFCAQPTVGQNRVATNPAEHLFKYGESWL